MKQVISMSLRGRGFSARSNPLTRARDCFVVAFLAMTLLISCAPVDLNAPLPTFDTGIDSNAWVEVPEGEFFFGK